MSDGYLFHSLEGLGAGCDVVDRVEDLGAVVSKTAGIADAYYDSFKNDKTLLVFECLAGNFLRPNGAFAVFAVVAVRTLLSALHGFHKQ